MSDDDIKSQADKLRALPAANFRDIIEGELRAAHALGVTEGIIRRAELGAELEKLRAAHASQLQVTVTARAAVAHTVVERDAARIKLGALEAAHEAYAKNLDAALRDAQLRIMELEDALKDAHKMVETVENAAAAARTAHRTLLEDIRHDLAGARAGIEPHYWPVHGRDDTRDFADGLSSLGKSEARVEAAIGALEPA